MGFGAIHHVEIALEAWVVALLREKLCPCGLKFGGQRGNLEADRRTAAVSYAARKVPDSHNGVLSANAATVRFTLSR
jgi:hypothetical protein